MIANELAGMSGSVSRSLQHSYLLKWVGNWARRDSSV